MRQGFKFVNPQREERLRLRPLVHRVTPRSAGGLRLCELPSWIPSPPSESRARSTSTSAAVEKTHRELSRALHPDRYVGRRRRASGGRRWRRPSRSTRRGASCAIRSARAEALLALGGRRRGAAKGRSRQGRSGVPDGDARAARGARRGQASKRSRRPSEGWPSAIEARARGVERALGRGLRARRSGRVWSRKVGELRFYRRFLDEVSAIEDELGA